MKVLKFLLPCSFLLCSYILSLSASPISQTTPLDSKEGGTTEFSEIIFRVEEYINENVTGDSNKQIPLPSDPVKDPDTDIMVVFRQEEEEEDETEEEEEEEEEVKPVVVSSTTPAPVSLTSDNPIGQEQSEVVSLKPKKPLQQSSNNVSPPAGGSPPQSLPTDESGSSGTETGGNLSNTSNNSPVSTDGEEGAEGLEVIHEEPSSSLPPPKPSFQPVQEGNFPIQEPGVFTRRTPPPIVSTTTNIPPPQESPLDTELDNSEGIPIEENPEPLEIVEVVAAPTPTIVQQPLLNGKYKITKPNKPKPTLDSSERQPTPSSTTQPPLSIAEEWNLTSSIFMLPPQGRADCECGKVPFKIDNADKSGINEYPWTVAIVRNGIFGGRPHCGGVLINNLYILSTASCFESFYADGLQVWLTAHNSLQAIDSHIPSDRVVKREVKEILMHPNYDRRTHENDIALVKLSYAVDISTSSYYVPACLPAGVGTYDGMTAKVMGWASKVDPNNRLAPNKMCKEDIPVVSNDVCNRDTSHRNKISVNQLCGGFLTKQPLESCIGDAGGPLMLPNNGRYTLIGLVSFGFSNREAYTPIVYTRVGNYADWILHNTQRDSDWCSL